MPSTSRRAPSGWPASAPSSRSSTSRTWPRSPSRCSSSRSTRFVNRDAELARKVIKKDDILDEKNVSIIRELLTYIAEYPGADDVLHRAHLDLQEPGARRGPRHQHLRGHDLHGRGPLGEAPRVGAALAGEPPVPPTFPLGRRHLGLPGRGRARQRLDRVGAAGPPEGARRALRPGSGHRERWRSDFELLPSLGANAYRYSLERSRIEPEPGRFSEEALAFEAGAGRPRWRASGSSPA